MNKHGYKLTEKGEASREFGRLFGLPLGDYYDPLISICTLRVSIDIVKLDERLHQEWGPYEERGQSMNDCILEHYGHDAAALIEKMI